MTYFKMKETILIIVAHPDDEIVAVGGSIMKYVSEDKDVVSIVLSFGESSRPLVQKRITAETRIEESRNVGKKLGCKETIFLGVPDGQVFRKLNDNDFIDKLGKIIENYNPNWIFTHSISDIFHPDHRATNKLVLKVVKKINYKGSLYSFDIWNPIAFFKRNRPKLYINITKYFDKKINAIKEFKSQWFLLYPLIPMVYLRARYYGREANYKYAERFYKVK